MKNLLFSTFSIEILVVAGGVEQRVPYDNLTAVMLITLNLTTVGSHSVDVSLSNAISEVNLTAVATVYVEITGVELVVEPKSAVSLLICIYC